MRESLLLRATISVLFLISIAAVSLGFYRSIFLAPLMACLAVAIGFRWRFSIGMIALAILGRLLVLVLAKPDFTDVIQGIVEAISFGSLASIFLRNSNNDKVQSDDQAGKPPSEITAEGTPTDIALNTSFVNHEVDTTRLKKMASQLRASGEFSEDQIKLVHQYAESALTKSSESISVSSTFADGMQIGPYVLQSLLGTGSSAQVFKATDANGDFVSIKLLRHLNSTDRFEREMQMVGTLAHPNIALAYETGMHKDRPYIVMEFLPGPNLDLYVRRQGCMNGIDSGRVVRQAALGLAHAHDRGLIHRDVKPANLLWDSNDRIKVSDLGLADSINDVEADYLEETFHTFEGQIAGTPDYMAPEQARSLVEATQQSDIFSLGATWQYLLTGKPRLSGTSISEKLQAVLSGDQVVELPETALSPAMDSVFRRMLERDPADRFESMHHVVAAIDEAMAEDAHATSDHPADKDAMLSILVVDDDEVDLSIAIRTLQKLNWSIHVNTAASLKLALEILDSETEVDLVLLDLNLSDSFGVKTVEKIVAKHSTKTIIVLSGDDNPDLAKACLAAGASEILSKNDLDAQKLERKLFIAQSRATRRSIGET